MKTMATKYNPASGSHELEWTPGMAALFGYWEQTMGPVEKPAKVPPSELMRSEPLIALVYRLVLWGRTATWESEDDRRELARIIQDAEVAAVVHSKEAGRGAVVNMVLTIVISVDPEGYLAYKAEYPDFDSESPGETLVREAVAAWDSESLLVAGIEAQWSAVQL